MMTTPIPIGFSLEYPGESGGIILLLSYSPAAAEYFSFLEKN